VGLYHETIYGRNKFLGVVS